MISELPFNSNQPELGKILEAIIRAGEKIIEIYESDFFKTRSKHLESRK